MKKFLAFVLALVLSLSLMACGSNANTDAAAGDDFQSSIMFCGSTSLYPIMSSLASSFTENYVTWDKVDPSMPDANISIYVAPGGSGVGVSAAIDKTADFGMLARVIKDEEVQALGENYSEYIVARDALTVSVNAANPICVVTIKGTQTVILVCGIGTQICVVLCCFAVLPRWPVIRAINAILEASLIESIKSLVIFKGVISLIVGALLAVLPQKIKKQ